MKYSGLKKFSIGNGEGIRVSLYVSGCLFHCEGCFNPETWDYNYGKDYTEEVEQEIISLIKTEKVDGLSLLGGDPLWQSYSGMKSLLKLVNETKKAEKTTWIWSAFTWEELMEDESEKENPELWQMRKELVSACDVWVDGRFVLAERNLKLQWCGSNNQRVIDVKKSLNANSVVLYTSNFTK